MATDSDTADERVALPADFAEHVAAIDDLDAPPATLEEWWTELAAQFAETGETIDLADLYSEAPTRHEVRVDGRVRYAHCAADALTAAALEEPETVTVRSVDPVSDVPITFTVTDDGVASSHEDAVVCFGSTMDAADVAAAGSLAEWAVQDEKSEVRDAVCQYTNAFENESTYEQWAAETTAVTVPLPPERIVQLVGDLVSKT